tara:strand:+ start:381 stop:662 length:282 start_codon:yes stop_codon:yes gene_type:complete
MNNTETQQITLKEIQDKLDILTTKINRLQKNKLENQIIDNADFLQLMNISNSTAKNWRNKGIIPYSQIESKFYYKVADIKLLLENNYSNFKVI